MANGRLADKAKLRDRCEILVEVVRKLGIIYSGVTVNDTQRHYIETIVGAALWYLPTSRELWTGAISAGAVKDFPRKVSAVELMKRAWEDADPSGAMLQLYLEKYGRFNYITPTENKVLVKHQKVHVFEQPVDAYKAANIRLLVITPTDLKHIRKRNPAVIENLLDT